MLSTINRSYLVDDTCSECFNFLWPFMTLADLHKGKCFDQSVRLGDLEVIHELWTPVGGAYNVDGVLRAGVSAWAIMACALTREAMLTDVGLAC